MKAQLISLNYQVPSCDTSLHDFPVVIGYAPDAEIRLEDFSVSKYHCQIDLIDGELVVQDLESVHGTFVNSTRIERTVLKHGDELAVGLMTFLVQFDRLIEKYGENQPKKVEKSRQFLSLSEMVAQ